MARVLTFHQQQALLQLFPRKLELFGFLLGQVPHIQGPQPTTTESKTLVNKYEDDAEQKTISSLHLLSEKIASYPNPEKEFLLVRDSFVLEIKYILM